MTVFLTGITGLVGSFIADILLSNGYEVKALVRKQSVKFPLSNKVNIVEGDILDPLLLNKEVANCDFVIHCAAIVSFSNKMLDEMMLTNIEGTKNIVNACLQNGVKRLVHISSIAAIGREEKSPIVNENTAWTNSDLNTNYAKSKYQAELEVWRGIEEGLEAIILNPSVVLGVSDWNKSSSKLFKYVFNEKPFYTNGNINVVDVRDVAKLALISLSSNNVNQRYIVANVTLTYKHFFEELAFRFNKKAPSILVSSFMAAIAWRVEWLKALITNKEPLVTKETAKTSLTSYIYENNKVIKDFNFQFIPLNETLDWACKEYINSSNIS